MTASVSGLVDRSRNNTVFVKLQFGFEESVSARGVLLLDRVGGIGGGLSSGGTLGLVECRRLHHGDHSDVRLTNNVW
jgi:hypothetical protein